MTIQFLPGKHSIHRFDSTLNPLRLVVKRSPIQLPDDQWFSIVQLAQLLKINPQHLRHLVEEGQLSPAIDLRSKGSPRACVRVSRDAVLEFIEEREYELNKSAAYEMAKVRPCAVLSGTKRKKRPRKVRV